VTSVRIARIWLFAEIRFDEGALSLERAGTQIELERRPLELLRVLLAHAGEVVTKDELLDTLWPDRAVTENSLTKCVARLRSALGDEDQAIIRTVHGYGYQFVATLRVESRPVASDTPEILGLTIGMVPPHRLNWRLIERLGSGLYAEAWLCEQTKTHERRVFKFAHDGEQLTGLKREITLSRLLQDQLGSRDDFARVLDWNLEQPPYFIERDWSPDGTLASDTIATLSLDGRIALAIEIAEALAAAHSVGVLHKDIKPANILIHKDAAGQLHIRLADFGSGGALDAERFGELGITPLGFTLGPEAQSSGRGTLVYCAPEVLAGGPASIQADVYSLGVVLYQLVTGDFDRPLAPGWEARISDPLLRQDIADAAAGDPAQRLTDAAQLAQRLRTLDERRIEAASLARARQEAELTRQALDRARARRVPIFGLIGVLVLGLLVAILLDWRAETANRRAAEAASRAEAVTQFLTTDLLSSANPLLSADPQITVKDLLASAAANLDQRFKPDTLERAAIEEVIGHAYAGLDDAARAEPLLTSALNTRIHLLGDADPATQRVRLDLLALYDHAQYDKQAEAMAEAILSSHPADAETDLRARVALADVLCNRDGNSETCVDRLRPLLNEARQKLGVQNDFFLETESTFAKILSLGQQFTEAIPLAREALALTSDRYGAQHPLVADRQYRLANVLSEAGQNEEANALCVAARQTLLAVSGHETEETANIANEIGIIAYQQQRYADAVPQFQLALDYHIKTRGEEFTGSRENMNDLAYALSGLGRHEEAIKLQQRVVDLDAKTVGADQAEALWREKSLGRFQEAAGHLAEAEQTYRSVIARARPVFTKGEWDLGQFEAALGMVLALEGKTAEARDTLQQSVAILSKALGPDDKYTKKAQAALDGLGKP